MSLPAEQTHTAFNIDLEQALIGAVMINNDAFGKVANIVTAESFHEPVHSHIWKVIEQMIGASKVADPKTLKSYLGEADLGAGVTPMAYLARLAAEATTVINAPDYARDLRDLHMRRRIIAIANAARALAGDLPPDMRVVDLIGDLGRDLDALIPAAGGDSSQFTAFGRIDTSDVHQAHKDQRGVSGISTGFERLDDLTNGLMESDLIILAGRPAMGKTALATAVGVNVARREQAKKRAGERPAPVAFFSIEMSQDQLKKRVLSDMAGVMMRKLMRGEAENGEMESFVRAEVETRDLPLYIDQTGEVTISQLRQKARRFKKLHGMSLLIIDYLQLIKGSNSRKNDNRVQEVTEITTGLKALAKELGVPILALSQLSRKLEDRDDKRPMLSDLRESGSIEQDADIVLFVYREEYYLRQTEPRDEGERLAAWRKRLDKWEGVAEVICGKNRHGSVGTAELGWEGHLTRFTPEPPYRAPDPEDARKAARRVKLTDRGDALKQIIMELSLTSSRRPTPEELNNPVGQPHGGLPRMAQMVDRDQARRLFLERIVPDLPEGDQKKQMQAGADNLRKTGLTGVYTNPGGQNFVYLIELLESD